MARTVYRVLGSVFGMVLVGALPALSEPPSPLATPPTPFATITAGSLPSASARVAATATRIAPSASPTPASRRAGAENADAAPGSEAPNGESAPLAVPTFAATRPRVFRTPERAVPQAFIAPDGASDEGGNMPASRGPEPAIGARPSAPRASTALVVFRATARTALEGFDLRVAYPRGLGSFGTSAAPAQCNAGTGLLVTANDRGQGELILLVASASALPLPLDVFCQFSLESGARLDAGAFSVRVNEVSSDGKRADPGLLVVNVAVR
jgi:hypothetical protein